MFNFPNSPTLGQKFTPPGGVEYTWDGVAWKIIVNTSGGSSAVTSVNSQIGDVVLDYADVGAAATIHSHVIGDVTGLQTALDGKAPVSHTHAAATTTALGMVFATANPGGQYVTGIAANGALTYGPGSTYTLPYASTTAIGGVYATANPGGMFVNGVNSTGGLLYSTVPGITGTAEHMPYYNAAGALTATPKVWYNASVDAVGVGHRPNDAGVADTRPWPSMVQISSSGVISQFGKDVGNIHYVNNSESVNTFPSFTGFVAYSIEEVFNPGGTNNSSVGSIATNNNYEFHIRSTNNNDLVLGVADQNNGGDRKVMRITPGGSIGVNGGGWLGGGMSLMSTDTAYSLAVASNLTPNDWWAVGPCWTGDGHFYVSYKGGATSTTGNLYIPKTGTSWVQGSDERIKDIIEPITDASDKVAQLRAVIGKFKDDPPNTRRSFLIAQDLLKVLPEVVEQSNPERLAVDYTGVIPLLVAALKEQADRIEALEALVGA